MKELYILTRLCALNTISTVLLGVTSVALVIASLMWFTEYAEYVEEDTKQIFRKWFKRGIYVLCISGMINFIIPSKKELIFIIGVGTIYDYAKDNKDLHEIPDKAIKALNTWLDEESK